VKLGRTGFGDIVPAMYPIPANPVMQAYYAQQQAVAASQKKGAGVSGMGLFVPAVFNEPDNPVRKGVTTNFGSNALGSGTFDGAKQLTGMKRNAVLSAHSRMKSAGPTSSGVVGGVHGLGDFDTSSLSNFMNSLTSSVCTNPSVSCLSTYGISNLVILGGLALVAVMMSQKSSASVSYRRR
jgi:hypothetical protein